MVSNIDIFQGIVSKLEIPVSWQHYVIDTDAVYTWCGILHLNYLVLFMTYWHKVQMSRRQTQPVVLRCGVRFRHGSLFRHQASGCVNSSSAARTLCGIGIAAYVATSLVGIFHLLLSRLYLTSFERASPIHTWQAGRLQSWTWRHLYICGLFNKNWNYYRSAM